MSRELNKIFDVKSRQARRDILDKFDLSKEDKNKVLNKIDSAGGESSGGGSGNEDKNIIYYKFDEPINPLPIFTSPKYEYAPYGIASIRATRDYVNYMYAYIYGISNSFGAWSENPISDAFAFAPFAIHTDREATTWVVVNTYEDLRQLYPDKFPTATRITAEEYWQYYNTNH